MKPLHFSWDPQKAISNARKHGVTFEEARTVFYDDAAVEFYDDEHSDWEDRFPLLVMSSWLRLILFCHCYRSCDSIIRIISARKATENEANYYKW